MKKVSNQLSLSDTDLSFIDVLFPKFKYQGVRHISIRNKNKQFKSLFCCKNDCLSDCLSKLKINNTCDYYISANSTIADKRQLAYLFSLDNIVIDIDCHNSDLKSLNYECEKLLYILFDFYDLRLPMPCVVVRSGRGLQLWWHIDSISSKLLFLYKRVVRHFCDVLSDIIKSNDIILNVDYTASCNAVGVFRLPNTFNTSSCSFVSYEIYNNISYSIHELIEDYDIKKFDVVLHQRETVEKVVTSNEDYIALQYKRIKFIQGLVNSDNDCVGNRDTYCFLYYNACVQVFNKLVAINKTNDLNNSFKEPLESLEHIYKYIDTKSFLKFKNENFLDMLGADETLIKKYENFERDEKRKMTKEERNKKIMQLAVKRYTCENISQEVGCSEKTVRTVLKDFDKKEFTAIQVKHLRKTTTMTQQQIADTLQISLRTVKTYCKIADKEV